MKLACSLQLANEVSSCLSEGSNVLNIQKLGLSVHVGVGSFRSKTREADRPLHHVSRDVRALREIRGCKTADREFKQPWRYFTAALDLHTKPISFARDRPIVVRISAPRRPYLSYQLLYYCALAICLYLALSLGRLTL